MSWNYRVVQQGPSLDETYAIHEVYYHEDGRPRSAALRPADAFSGSLEGLRWQLEQMTLALDKPVLTEEDFGPAKPSVPNDYRSDLGADP